MGKLLILIVALGAILKLNGTETTLETTCKGATDNDKRIDYNFCVSQLKAHHDSTEADTWGLAKITPLIGANNSDSAAFDIKALLAKPGTGGKMRVALEECQNLYKRMAYAFAGAHDDINGRNYPAGQKKVAEAIPLAHKCEEAFVKVGVRSPLTKRAADSMQLAIICMAITDLIK